MKEEFSLVDNKIVKGVYSALVSPIDRNGNLKKDVLCDLIDWQLAQGMQGFYITGATGEGCQMKKEARMELVETAIRHINGRAPAVVHIAAANMEDAKEFALQAKAAGATALSATPPPTTAYSEAELYEYYKELSSVCDLPFLVYAQKYFQQSSIVGFFENLMELPNIAGLKYTRSSYYEMNQLTQLNGRNINVINGPDEMLICGLVMGADGGIGSTYNVMPQQFRQLFEAYQAGDLKTAKEIQEAVNAVVAVIIRHGVIPTVKYMLTMLGFEVGEVEKPGKVFSAEEKAAIRQELIAVGYDKMYPQAF